MPSPEMKTVVVPVVNMNSTGVTEKRLALFNEWEGGLRANNRFLVGPRLVLWKNGVGEELSARLKNVLKIDEETDAPRTVFAVLAGDGTLNSLLNAVAQTEYGLGNVQFLFLRSGEVNVYGDLLGHTLDPAKLNQVLFNGQTLEVDIEQAEITDENGNINRQLGLLSLGLIHPFLHEHENARHRVKGMLQRRVVAASLGLPKLKSVQTEIVLINEKGESRQISGPMALVEISNGERIMNISPARGTITDGLITVMYVGASVDTYIAGLRILTGLLWAHLGWKNNPFLKQSLAREVSVKTNRPVAWHFDGEPGSPAVEWKVTVQGSVNFLVK